MKRLENTTRVQLELGPNTMKKLTNLKELTEAASYSEVIRNAINAYAEKILQCNNEF